MMHGIKAPGRPQTHGAAGLVSQGKDATGSRMTKGGPVRHKIQTLRFAWSLKGDDAIFCKDLRVTQKKKFSPGEQDYHDFPSPVRLFRRG